MSLSTVAEEEAKDEEPLSMVHGPAAPELWTGCGATKGGLSTHCSVPCQPPPLPLIPIKKKTQFPRTKLDYKT